MASTSDQAFVWVWLPSATRPVPAGRLQRRGTSGLWFEYGRGYLARPDAVSLSPTLPLSTAAYGPTEDLGMPDALRDGSPDAWARRVIPNRLTGPRGLGADPLALDELTYLLESGSHRLGAIDFQATADIYRPKAESAGLDELHRAAQIVEATDPFPVSAPRLPGIELARVVGIAVPRIRVTSSLGRACRAIRPTRTAKAVDGGVGTDPARALQANGGPGHRRTRRADARQLAVGSGSRPAVGVRPNPAVGPAVPPPRRRWGLAPP